MALNWNNQAASIESANGLITRRSADAFERGAARRRGRPDVRPSNPLVETRKHELLANLRLAPPTTRENGATSADAIVVVDPVWRARVEADLRAVHDAVARLDAGRALDSEALRAAVGKWSGVDAPDQWAEQLGRLQAQLEQLEQAIRTEIARTPAPSQSPQDAGGRLGGDSDQIEALGRMIEDLTEREERTADMLSILSRELGSERLRTTVIIMAGTAAALMSAAVWLMSNTLAF